MYRNVRLIVLASALAAFGCREERKGPSASNQPDAGPAFIDTGVGGPTDFSLIVDPSALQLTEGGAGATLSVRLDSAPSADVTVQVGSSDLEAVDAVPGSLTFTAMNFGTAQTITVTPKDDADADDETVTLTVSAAGAAPVTVTVTITDDETQAIVVAPTMAAVNEGGTATIAVSLAAEPVSATTVNIASAMPGSLGAAPATLTFDASTWSTPQTITLTGTDDDDVDDLMTTVTLSATDFTDVNVPVTVFDDDQLGILVDPTMVNLDESGAARQVQVRLTSRPDADVTVTIGSSDDGAVSVGSTTLTFMPGTWDQAQAVDLTAVDDDDVDDEQVTISFEAANLTTRTVTAVVDDDDEQTIDLGPNSLSIREGEMDSFSLRLRYAPRVDTTLTVASSDPARTSLMPVTLTFTSTDYADLQTVNVDALHDPDAAPNAVVLTVTGAGTSTTVSVAIEDDDEQRILAGPSALTIDENGTGQIGVALAAQPLANVTVTVTSTNSAAVSVAPASLTFTPTDWSTPKPITVSGEDDLDGENASADVLVSATMLGVVRVRVDVLDDDVQQVQVSPASLGLTEGGTVGTLDVRLALPPSGNVTVDIASNAPAVAAVNPAVLTFGPNDWDQLQQVSVTAVQDDDTAVGTATIALSSTGLTTRQVPVGVADDDTQTIIADVSQLDLQEGQTGRINYSLEFDPLGTLTVNVAALDTGTATVSPASLTFDSNSYSTPQPVTVTAVHDVNVANGSTTVRATASAVAATDVPVNVTDIDEQAIVLDQALLSVDEGQTVTLGVSLAFQPSGDVTLTVTSSAGLTANPLVVTLTPTDWSDVHPVVLTADHDDDTEDARLGVTVGGGGLAAMSAAVDVDDDDTQAIVVSTSSVAIDEGGAAGAVTVRLAFQPSETVTVSLTNPGGDVLQIGTESIDFGPGDWNVAVPVTLTAIEDDDTIGHDVTLSVAADGLTTQTVLVEISDDDIQAIELDRSMFTMAEGDATTVNVNLAFNPVGGADVTITSLDEDEATVTPGILTFGSGDWDQAVPITITAVHDENLATNTVQILLTSPGVGPRTIDITITDDDEQALVLTPEVIDTTENETPSFSVALRYEPVATITVDVTSPDPGAVSAPATSLTFLPTAYDTPQAVDLTAEDDTDADDEQVVLQITASDGTTAELTVNVIDDESQSIVVTPTNLSLTEGAQADTFDVRLAFAPAANTTVTLETTDSVRAAISHDQIIFSPTNFDDPVTVTVTPGGDDDTQDDGAVISVASTGLTTRNVTVSIEDDDDQSLEVVDTAFEVAEGGDTTFTVNLAFDPLATITVTVVSDDPGGADVAPAELVFDSDNYGDAQEVTVSGTPDIDLANETVTITVSSTITASVEVTATVNDDDEQAIEVSTTELDVDENGTATFTVELEFLPASDVLVDLAVVGDGISVDTSSITFTAADFNIGRTILVSGLDDVNVANEQPTVRITSLGLDTVDVDVQVDDDDEQAIEVTTALVELTEGGDDVTFEVTLAYQPTNDVTVTIASDEDDEATASPTSLTFTSGDYNLPQEVDVSPTDDLDTRDEDTTIRLTSSDAIGADVSVTVADDDEQGIVLDTEDLTITEGDTATFRVRLAYDPVDDLEVSVASLDTDVATVGVDMITFTSDDYTELRDVVVTAEHDDDLAAGATTINVTADGGLAESVPVTVNDEDEQALEVSIDDASFTEGDDALTFTVNLAFQPAGAVTVSVESDDAGAASVTPTTLEFDDTNWYGARDVTLTAQQDDDTADETATISVSATDVQTEMIAVTVEDEDVQTHVVTGSPVDVDEGQQATITVALEFDPVDDVTVTLTSSDDTELSLSATELTFTTDDYDAQTVTITAQGDPDPITDSFEITVSSSVAVSVTVPVTVTDDETILAIYAAPGPVTTISDSIDPVGNVDVIEIQASGDFHLRAETFAPTAGLCNSDTVLRVLDSNGDQLLVDDQGGINSCSKLDPNTESTRLAAGTYYLTVEDWLNNTAIAAYLLEIEGIAADVCGNGVLETGINETCDDGNTTAGDGCSATCTFEGTGEGEPNDDATGANLLAGTEGIFRGSIDPIADVDFIAVDVPDGYHLEAYMTVNSFTSCPADPRGHLTLIDTDGTTPLYLNSTGGPNGGCGRIDAMLTRAAHSMTAGRYYLRVRESLDDNTIDNYFVHFRVIAPGCGNAIVEGTEHCDDGNTIAGDGCSDVCAYEPVATYTTSAGTTTVAGSIDTIGDRVIIEIVATATVALRAETFMPTAAAGTCTGGDTVMRLYDTDGTTLLGSDDDDGVSLCSLIAPANDAFAVIGAGTYYLSIEEYLNNATIAGFEVVLSSVGTNVCGNRMNEAGNGEQCDDGNLIDGDGCDSMCQLEIAATVTPPGASHVVNLAANPGFQLIQIDTTIANQSITATTSDGTAGCGYDTYIELLDASFNRLGSDDIDGPDVCAAISPWRDSFAKTLDVGTYYVLVQSERTIAGSSTLDVVVTDAECANALVEHVIGENCDDGNTVAGDGCNSMCMAEGVTTETEGNDDIANADDSGLSGAGTVTLGGDIGTVGDEDFYSFVVPAGQSLTLDAQTYGTIGNLATCLGDTRIHLQDAAGTELTSNDDGGEGRCSHIDAHGPLTEGTYYLRVRHWNNAAVIPYYFMNVSLQ